MMAALSERPDFYQDKLNVIILLAPVSTVHGAGGKFLQMMKDKEFVVEVVKSLGPEVMSVAQSKLKSTAMAVTDLGKIGIAQGADSNLNHLSKQGTKTYIAHYPAGASF